MEQEYLKELEVEFSLQQLMWLSENTDLKFVFSNGKAYQYIGTIGVSK